MIQPFTHIIAWIHSISCYLNSAHFQPFLNIPIHSNIFLFLILRACTLWCCNLKSKSHKYFFCAIFMDKRMKISWKKMSSNLSLYQNTRSIRIKGRCIIIIVKSNLFSSLHLHYIFDFFKFNSLIFSAFFCKNFDTFSREKIFCLKDFFLLKWILSCYNNLIFDNFN